MEDPRNDEEHETPETNAEQARVTASGAVTPASPMPLSMPPFTPIEPAASAPVEGAPTPPLGTPVTAPMPLSMPPFTPPTASGGAMPPAGGASVPPVDAGGGWAFADAPLPPSSPEQPHHRSRRPLAVILGAVVVAGGLGAGLGATLGSSSPTGSASGSSGGGTNLTAPVASTAPLQSASSVSAISKVVTPAVVDISTNVASADGAEEAAGTGMIITSSGEVLTNNHVIEDATKISVTIQGRTGSYGVTVLGVDPSKDVALLQIDGVSGLPYVSLGNSSSVQVGDAVVALGNALGIGGAPSVVSGAVTGLDRSINASDEGSITATSENLSGLIETDAQIEPGDSGGPLVNTSGQVIGMDTAAASSDGSATIGFAIPINAARTIVDDIVKGDATDGIILGKSTFLGVDVAPANTAAQSGTPDFGGFGGNFGFGNTGSSSAATTSTNGQFVEAVVTGGPAAAAGIEPGDTITSIDGSKVTNNSGTLTNELAKLRAGTKTTVGFVDSSGTSHTVTVTLGSIPK